MRDNFINWDSKYATGHAEIDEQHEKDLEDKINEYIQDDYSLFSHQMSVDTNDCIVVQLVFIKED